jgi:hypothetical protein
VRPQLCHLAHIPPIKPSSILRPLILPTDLVFFLGRELVGNVEGSAYLFSRFSSDHGCDSFAAVVHEWLDVEVIGGL